MARVPEKGSRDHIMCHTRDSSLLDNTKRDRNTYVRAPSVKAISIKQIALSNVFSIMFFFHLQMETDPVYTIRVI